MSFSDDIMHWYKNCGHEITLSQTNKKDGYLGVAICKDTNDLYRAYGEDVPAVLKNLKSMLNGHYSEV